MNALFEFTEEKSFLDHLAFETVQYRPNSVYRWCRDHEVEPHELAPLGTTRGNTSTLRSPKRFCPYPWQSASQFRKRARAAADFLRAQGKWDEHHSPSIAQPMTRHEREFYDLWMGEYCDPYFGRASYLLAKHGINFAHMGLLWDSYHAAWNALGYSWCYIVPPLPLDFDLPCPWGPSRR